jgi:hypothetical protein
MRKNRKVSKKMSRAASRSMHVGAVILMLFVMEIMNLLASSSCNQYMKTIGEKRKLLEKLEKDRERESANWERMKTPEKLEAALVYHGHKMRYPRQDQIIRLKSDGTAYPGLAVNRAKRMYGAEDTAQLRRRKGR